MDVDVGAFSGGGWWSTLWWYMWMMEHSLEVDMDDGALSENS